MIPVKHLAFFPSPKYLIYVSWKFHALSICQILFHSDPLVSRSNPSAVNGNLGIILHAVQGTWKAGHSDWFSHNWEIWDKSRDICVLIARVADDITPGQLMWALVRREAIGEK